MGFILIRNDITGRDYGGVVERISVFISTSVKISDGVIGVKFVWRVR